MENGFEDFYKKVDIILMGRFTFEKQLTQGPWPYTDKKTYVFSKTLKNQFGPEIEVTPQDPAFLIEDLKLTNGKSIWLAGGVSLVRYLMKENLVDEIVLNMHPQMLGQGLDLFPLPLHTLFWHLKSSTELPSGVVQIHYVGNSSSES